MTTSTTPETILDELGDKFLGALIRAVSLTRQALAHYREVLPESALVHSPRGLANWIHDMLWYHLQVDMDSVDEVEFHESGATREILVHGKFRIRIKRHDHEGGVSSYPTPTAKEFYCQLQLDGFEENTLEEVRLTAGYIWIHEIRNIGSAVVAMHSSMGKVEWKREFNDPPVSRIEPLVARGPASFSIEPNCESDREISNSASNI